MMNDTSLVTKRDFEKMLMARSGESRLKMACSMFDSAKKIVISSILEKNPEIELSELRKAVFLRFYDKEFFQNNRQHL